MWRPRTFPDIFAEYGLRITGSDDSLADPSLPSVPQVDPQDPLSETLRWEWLRGVRAGVALRFPSCNLALVTGHLGCS